MDRKKYLNELKKKNKEFKENIKLEKQIKSEEEKMKFNLMPTWKKIFKYLLK